MKRGLNFSSAKLIVISVLLVEDAIDKVAKRIQEEKSAGEEGGKTRVDPGVEVAGSVAGSRRRRSTVSTPAAVFLPEAEHSSSSLTEIL
ncbi:unnamed protein product [Caretta caretta]